MTARNGGADSKGLGRGCGTCSLPRWHGASATAGHRESAESDDTLIATSMGPSARVTPTPVSNVVPDQKVART